jgi:hypothetical protein
VQPLHQFVPDVFLRGRQAFQALIRIFVVTFHVDPHLRRTAIVGDVYCGHAHQSNSRICQFAFDERFNFLAQSFANSPAMIFEPALLSLAFGGEG